MYNTELKRERFVLVAVIDNDDEDLTELALLAETSGGDVVGRVIQKRESAHPGHYLGKGKIEELQALTAEFVIVL